MIGLEFVCCHHQPPFKRLSGIDSQRTREQKANLIPVRGGAPGRGREPDVVVGALEQNIEPAREAMDQSRRRDGKGERNLNPLEVLGLHCVEVKGNHVGRTQKALGVDVINDRLSKGFLESPWSPPREIDPIEIGVLPKRVPAGHVAVQGLIVKGCNTEVALVWKELAPLFEEFIPCEEEALDHSFVKQKSPNRLRHDRVNLQSLLAR
mmetsp:Transcript_5505/g.10909  ORF Transcript_5505/g.10909 Transcript_5505/m.10909 type:complete len:208 (-) Transcript_5505:761-1384(-)